MPDRRRKHCGCCGLHETEVGPISWRGNCSACGVALFEENARGISERRGPAHARRLRGMAQYLQRAALDTMRDSP